MVISSQKPTVLEEKEGKEMGGVRFEKEGNTFSKKYRTPQYPEKFKSKKRRESDFFLFSYYKKWNLEIGEK